MRRSSQSCSSTSDQAGAWSSRGVISQAGSRIPSPLSSSCRLARIPSHPGFRYVPRYRAMSSGKAWSGQWGAVYPTYRKNGWSPEAAPSIMPTASLLMASVR